MLRSLFVSSFLFTLNACDGDTPAEPAPAAETPPIPAVNAKRIELGEPRAAPTPGQFRDKPAQKRDPRVSCRTSREQLTEHFGEDALEDADIDVGEGITQPGTVVAAGTPHAQEVVWKDAERTLPERITVRGDGIRDPQGLGLGTTLAELEESIGPFQLTGFGWDYGGTVFLEGTRLAKMQDRVFFRLQPGDTDSEAAKAALDVVAGDALFSSSDQHVKALDLTVGELLVICPETPRQAVRAAKPKIAPSTE